MIYISHLLPDHEMSEIIEQTGVGIESIEFSIADNLDHLNDSIGSYRERLKFMDCRTDPAWTVYEYRSRGF